jgi:putative ABC transport system ATP-binding protein
MKELVRLESISKRYVMGRNIVTALDEVSLSIHEGEYVAIMGHSGSGKSTMLNVLGCLDKPTSGQYFLGGLDVSTMDDAQLSDVRGRRIGFVFQSFNLIPQISVTANIEVPLFYLGMPRARRHPRSRELAEMVGLGNRMDHKPTELSGGQRQRVAVARALANDPLLILADEPTGNLDTRTSQEIMELFDDLYRRGRTILLVTHEDDVARHARRVVRLKDGKVESDQLSERGQAELEASKA